MRNLSSLLSCCSNSYTACWSALKASPSALLYSASPDGACSSTARVWVGLEYPVLLLAVFVLMERAM